MGGKVIEFKAGQVPEGRRCSLADFKQRRLERRMKAGLVELVPIDEYLARHRDAESAVHYGAILPFDPNRARRR